MENTKLLDTREAGGPVVRLFRWVFIYPGLVVLLYLFLNSFLRTGYFSTETYNEVVWFRWDNLLVNLLVLAGSAGIVALALNERVVCLLRRVPLEDLLACTMGLLGVCWVLMNRINPIGEALNVTSTAQSFLQGDYTAMEPGGYVHMFPFQLGYIGFIELLYRLFGPGNILAPQLLSALALVVCYKAQVRITHLLFRDEVVTRLVCILGFFSPYTVPYTAFIYGILPGLAFGLVAVWAALACLRQRRWHLAAVAVVCAGLAVLLKPNSLIFSIGLVLVLLLEALRGRCWWQVPLAVCILLASLLAPVAVEKWYEQRSGIGLEGGVPSTAHIAMGLSDDGPIGPGWYNGMTYRFYRDSSGDLQVVDDLAAEVVGTRLAVYAADPLYAVRFLHAKTATQWNEASFGGMQVTHSSLPERQHLSRLTISVLEGERLQGLIVDVMAGYQMVVYFAAAFALWWNRRRWRLPQLLPFVITLGGFAFHLFWEAKSQYILPYFFLLAPYAAAGLAWLLRGPVEGLWYRVKIGPGRVTGEPEGRKEVG